MPSKWFVGTSVELPGSASCCCEKPAARSTFACTTALGVQQGLCGIIAHVSHALWRRMSYDVSCEISARGVSPLHSDTGRSPPVGGASADTRLAVSTSVSRAETPTVATDAVGNESQLAAAASASATHGTLPSSTDKSLAYPTDSKEKEKNKRDKLKAAGIKVEVKKKKFDIQDHFDDCGEDLSSLVGFGR